jgi:hypothetical protein
MFMAEDKNAFFAKLVAETLPKFLTNAEKFLKEHGGEYFVGNHVSKYQVMTIRRVPSSLTWQ